MTVPGITITNLIWSFDRQTQHVNLLLLKRNQAPFDQNWALPETTLRDDESADDAALRLVREKIGLTLDSFHTEQLATFTHPHRTPGLRAVALAYMTFLPQMPPLTPGYGASDARWFCFRAQEPSYLLQNGETTFRIPVTTRSYYTESPDQQVHPRLAFDHDWMIAVASQRIRNKLDYQPNILLTLGATFTLREARTVFATFLRCSVTALDNSNFKKNHRQLFTAVGTTSAKRAGRPATLYRLNYLPLTDA